MSSAQQQRIRRSEREGARGGVDRGWVADRTYWTMSALTHDRQRLLDAQTVADYQQMLERLAFETVELATGRWSAVEGYSVPDRTSRFLAVLRPVATGAVLVAAALALPSVPGMTSSALVTGVQVSLVSAAVTTILPLAFQPQGGTHRASARPTTP